MTWTARPAAAEEGLGGLTVDIPGAPRASRNAYEVTLSSYDAEPGTPTGSSGAGEPVSPWTDTTVAFRVPYAGANKDLHAWVADARAGRADARDVHVHVVHPTGASSSFLLQSCLPVALTRAGFEVGVGAIEVLTLSVVEVTPGGQQDA